MKNGGIASNSVYPGKLGYDKQFEAVVHARRPELKD